MKSKVKLDKLFLEGIARGGDIAQGLKPLYIEWLVLTEGIGHARLVFENTLVNPPCLELFRKMAALESMQPDAKMKSIRRCHELAVTHFGSDNTGVWLEYVNFEMKFGEPPRATLLYQRATKALNEVAADQFALEFNSLKLNSQTPSVKRLN